MDEYIPNPANYKMKENPKRDISESDGGYTKVLAPLSGSVNPDIALEYKNGRMV